MRFNPAADSSMGTLLLELAQSLSGAIGDMVAEVRAACADDSELENLCCACEVEGQRLAQTMGYLGAYMNDPAIRAKVSEETAALQGRCTHLAQVARSRGKEGLAARAEELEMTMASLARAIAIPGYDIDPEMLPYLRASYVALEESAIIASNPQNAAAVAQSSDAIKDTVGILIDHAKKVGETNADGSGERMFEYSRQIALATKALVSESESATPNYENLAQAAMDVNAAVNAMIGDDMLAMHKVVLLDRSKQACTDSLHAAVAVRAAARAPARSPADRKALIDAALAAQRAVAGLLESVSGAVGHEGDERVNVNSLAGKASAFCPEITSGFIEPVSVVSCEEVGGAVKAATESVAALNQETQIFRTVGRLADIEFATERFHAAESVLLATIFANDANKLKPVGTRAEVMEVLPQAAARFGNALKAIAQAVKAGQPFTDPLVELSAATQDIMLSSRSLVSNSRFKHERETIIDASKQLSTDVNLLIDGLKRVARDDMDGTIEGIAQAIGGSVGALQRIVALAQQEGGALHLEAGELGTAGPEADAELEAEANQCLIDAKAEIESTAAHLDQVAAALAESGNENDTRTQVRKAILDSVKALVTSTGVVVSSSCEAQAELVAALSVPSTRANYARDPSLAEGLCDASNQVLVSVRDLTRGIDPDTIDTISQKEIAEHAESVSKAVEILAAAVRAGIKGGSQKLIDAARAVSEACMQLLEVAKMIDDMPDEKVEEDEENFGIDSYTMKEIEIQMKIAELESKLAKAKRKYDRLMNTTIESSWNNA